MRLFSSYLSSTLRLAAVLIALGACQQPAPPADRGAQAPADNSADGDDPLASLRATTPSTRYNEGFWKAQMTSAEPQRQQLWAQAYSYCGRKDVEADGARPNCRGVMSAAATRSTRNTATGGHAF